MFNRRLDLWLPTYALTAPARAYGRLRRRRQLTHLMFLVCDHFEPRHDATHRDQPFERLRSWRQGYARLQDRCRRSFGTSPVHTWFYPPHHGSEHLASLSEMVFDGLGEVELHYHHDNDTAATLRDGLRSALQEYRRWGMLLESGDAPRTAFGFVHGDWALDNSCGGEFCGVNGELEILQEFGCWGDFTMPSGNSCQTRKINAIYYASGDPSRSKAHDWGVDARAGRKDPPGLFLMQGPLGINWRAPRHPRIENAGLTSRNWGRPDRVHGWLDANVHVKGRPDWQFVKLHTHGALEEDFDALFGDKAFEMHRTLNEQFNDGQRYRLHYVTARQAYNIAKAAEHGCGGSPSDWLDFLIRPQAHAFYTLDAPHDLECCTEERLVIRRIETARTVALRSRIAPIARVEGAISAIHIDRAAACLQLEAAGAGAEVRIEMADGYRLEGIDGAQILENADGAMRKSLRLAIGPQCRVRYARDDAAAVDGKQRS